MPWYVKNSASGTPVWDPMRSFNVNVSGTNRSVKLGFTKVTINGTSSWKCTFVRAIATTSTCTAAAVSAVQDTAAPITVSGTISRDSSLATNTSFTDAQRTALAAIDANATITKYPAGTVEVQRSDDGGISFPTSVGTATLSGASASTYSVTDTGIIAGTANKTYVYRAIYTPGNTFATGYPWMAPVTPSSVSVLVTSKIKTTLSITAPDTVYARRPATYTVSLIRTDNGAVIPGASISITGAAGSSTVTTDSNGQATITYTPAAGTSGSNKTITAAFSGATIGPITYNAASSVSLTKTIQQNVTTLDLTIDKPDLKWGTGNAILTASSNYGGSRNILLERSTDQVTWTTVVTWGSASASYPTGGAYLDAAWTASYTFDRTALATGKTSTYYFRLSAANATDYTAATSSVTTSNSTINTRRVEITAVDGNNNSLSVINPGDQWFIFARVFDESNNKIIQRADVYDKTYGNTETLKATTDQNGSTWFLGSFNNSSTDPYTRIGVGGSISIQESHRIRFSYPALDGYSAVEKTFTLNVKQTYSGSSFATKVIKIDGSLGSVPPLESASMYIYQGTGLNDTYRTLISFTQGTTLQKATSAASTIVAGSVSFQIPSTNTVSATLPNWSSNNTTLYINVLNSSAINFTNPASPQFIGGYNDNSADYQAISIARSSTATYATFNLNNTMLSKFTSQDDPGRGILVGFKDSIGYNGMVVGATNFLWLYGHQPSNPNNWNPSLSLTYYMDPSQ